jgi:YD repeat-containing protein
LYRYDQANRLISTTLSGATTLFNYNGDGVRLKQVIAGVPTTYTQDLVAPPPVVLQAKTGTVATQYLFSLGTRPVAQYTSSAFQYLLPDALGSVRQIADANSNIVLTESYEPYGKLLMSSGSAT